MLRPQPSIATILSRRWRDRPAVFAASLLVVLLAGVGGLAAGRVLAREAKTGAPLAAVGPTATHVHLPALDYLELLPDCSAVVSVQNLGPTAAKGLLLLWQRAVPDAPGCAGPAELMCSGLLQPGSTWTFHVTSLDVDAASGVVYSFSAERLSDIGVTGVPDEVVADYACRQLRTAVLDDCNAYSTFADAYRTGGTYAGLPMAKAVGSPLAATVWRSCPGDATPGVQVSSQYDGIGADALGSADASFGGYRYLAAPIHANHKGLWSLLHVQNAGATAATIELWFQAAGACDGGERCRTMTLNPGATAVVNATDCRPPSWTGSAWLKSSGPLAVTVDTVGRDGLATFNGVAPSVATGPTGEAVFAGGDLAAYGPLSGDPDHGWESEVTVQNLSLTAATEVLVEFLDHAGTVRSTEIRQLCARGSETIVLPLSGALWGGQAASVRVLSRAPSSNPTGPAAPISAVVTLYNYDDGARSQTIETLAYNAMGASRAFRWPAGAGTGGAASGSPVVAIPAWGKDTGGAGASSELAVTNLVAVPGWTDAAILVYDQNDLVDVYCRRLGAGQTTYLDTQTLSAVTYGFHGSALVSATYWEHPVAADANGPARQLVGLGAVALWRTGTRRGEDIPGDELAASTGVALATWPAAAELPADPCGTIARPAGDMAPGGHWQSVVPVFANVAGMNSTLHLRNTGDEPSAVRLYFHALGDCLRDKVCHLDPLAAGEEVDYEVGECVGPDWAGNVAVHSGEPLALSAEAVGPGAPAVAAGRPGRSPFDLNHDGRVDGLDAAIVQSALGTTPGSPAWNALADLDANGVINDVDVYLMTASLCGADRAPDSPDPVASAHRADRVALPVLLADRGRAICSADLTVQNIGGAPAKLLLVTWGEPAIDGSCTGPRSVTCSGLVGPSGSWHYPAGTISVGATGGLLFSLTTEPLSAIGATVGGDDPTADYVCRTLMSTAVGDCAAYEAFATAFATGALWQGVPMARAAGSSVAATVRRECPGDMTPGVEVTAAYDGLGANNWPVLDTALNRYVTYAPLIYAAKAGFNTTFYVQNVGTAVANTAVWFQAQDDCAGAVQGEPLLIQPGETRAVVPGACPNGGTGSCPFSDWQGNGWLESNQPLALVVEIHGRDTRMSYPGAVTNIAVDANGQGLPSGGRTTAFGPLAFQREFGWDTGVQVQNLRRNGPARVRVELLDAQGAPLEVMEDLICAAGSQTYFFPVVDARPGMAVGSVRVVSQRLAGNPASEPAAIAALLTAFQYSDPARTNTLAAGAYELLPERAAAAREPTTGGRADGIAVIALPGLVKAGGGNDANSAIALSNLILAPGETSVAVQLFDANGLVDVQCRRLAAGTVDYLDLATLGLAPGFQGSAAISATSWQHWVGGTDRGPRRNLVGLGAVAVTRRLSAPADDLGMVTGLPLAKGPEWLVDVDESCAPVTIATPTPGTAVTPATATPSASPTAGTPTQGSPTATAPTVTTPTVATPTPPTRTATPTNTSPQDHFEIFLPIVSKSVRIGP
jgi:hypothetical protein